MFLWLRTKVMGYDPTILVLSSKFKNWIRQNENIALAKKEKKSNIWEIHVYHFFSFFFFSFINSNRYKKARKKIQRNEWRENKTKVIKIDKNTLTHAHVHSML